MYFGLETCQVPYDFIFSDHKIYGEFSYIFSRIL